jgi:hypothetical protein
MGFRAIVGHFSVKISVFDDEVNLKLDTALESLESLESNLDSIKSELGKERRIPPSTPESKRT